MAHAVAERFVELELELREGDEAELEPLADMLAEIEELVAVDSSKFERALEVVRREPREVVSDDAGASDVDRRCRGGPSVDAVRGATPKAAQGGAGGGRGGDRGVARRGERQRAEAETADGAGRRARARPGAAADPRPEVAGRARRRPHRRGRPQGAALPPRAHGRPRGGDARGEGGRGAARDARRDPAPAGGLAGVRRRLRPEAHGPPPQAAAPRRRRPRRGPRPRRPDRVDRGLPAPAACRGGGGRSSRCVRSWRVRRETSREVLVRELDAERYRRWLDGYLRSCRPRARRSTPSARPSRIASGTRCRRASGARTRRCAPTSP